LSNEQDNTEQVYDPALVKLTEWDKEPSVMDLKQDYEAAKSDYDAHIAQVNTWLDNLNVTGAAAPKKLKGRSSVQPKLIRKQAEWRYSSLAEPFLSTDDLFNVAPVTYEDRPRAHQNELILNNQFNTKLNKVKFINEYVRAAVDEGTAVVRVGWDYEETTVMVEKPIIEFQPIQTQEEMQFLQAAAQGQEGLEEEWYEAAQLSQQSGQALKPVVVGSEEVEEVLVLKNQPTVEVCDYNNVIIDPTCNGEIDKASFVIYSFETSISELQKDGKYSNLESINVEGATPLNEPDHATKDQPNFRFNDKPRKKIVAYEYWGYWDIDGSGVVKPIVATWVGNTMIRMEENPFPDGKLPFVVVQYLPVRKSIYGEPDGALLEDNQRIIGAVTRGMIDIMGKSANGQTGVRKDALDVTNRRKFERGDDYEFNANIPDPRAAIFMHTYPEIPNSAYTMVQMQNQEAESLTGVKAYSTGIASQALGNVATGIRGALDAASKRELNILRRLADGIVQIGRKIIAMNAEFLSEQEVIRITNEEFITVDREDLAGNFDLKLTISTAEEDNQKAQELAFMLQTMGNNLDPSMSKIILSEIARLRKMPDLAKQIQEFEPQPDPMVQQMQQLEMQKLQMEIAEIQARIQNLQTDSMLDQAKTMSEQAKAENLQSDTDLKNLDFVEQESGVKQERDLQKMNEQSKAQAKTKLIEYGLKQRENQVSQNA
jgi:hypothetical protein